MDNSISVTVSPKDGAITCVFDLDRTLITSDLLVESGFAHFGSDIFRTFLHLRSLKNGGTSRLKADISTAL
jgi:hypothetical protein